MNVLDSPLEALAINYVSFGFFTIVNNLWTWIAVVTAAVSFWRIRVAGGVFPVEESPPQDDRSSLRSSPAPEKPSPVASPPPEEKRPPSPRIEEIAATRGSPKFALYYYDNDTDGEPTVTEEEECLESDGGELTVTEEEQESVESDGDGGGEEWWRSWERVLRTKMGESETAGWYRYQDLTELNGNVVRLWDGRDHGRRSSNSGEESFYYCVPTRCVLW